MGIEVAHPGIEKARERIYEDALEEELKQHAKNRAKETKLDMAAIERSAIERAGRPESRHNRNLFRSSKHRKYYTYYQWVCFA